MKRTMAKVYAFGVLGSQHAALKAKSKTIAGLIEEVDKLVTEKQTMD